MIKKAKETDEKIIRIIMKQNLPAEQIERLLEKNLKYIKIDGVGKLKNKYRKYRETAFLKKARQKEDIRKRNEKQVAYEKRHPNIFASERIKDQLSSR